MEIENGVRNGDKNNSNAMNHSSQQSQHGVREYSKRFFESNKGTKHKMEKHAFSTFAYCNLCKELMWGISNSGSMCYVCGFSAHGTCMETIELPENCRLHSHPALCGLDPSREKETFSEFGIDHNEDLNEIHHWIEGNAQMASHCFACNDSITSIGSDCLRCSRCRLSGHKECVLGSELGVCTPLYDHLQIRRLEMYKHDYHRPLLVFVNTRSGGHQGMSVLCKFSKLLNPCQVIDLDLNKPLEVLKMFQSHPNLKLLCCGGDGTVGWVLSVLDLLPDFQPGIAILPLGTGNDLARSLGWGGGYSDEKISEIIQQIDTAEVVRFDRWNIRTITKAEDGSEIINDTVMNNYFSIGVDASVTLAFHKMRNEMPSLCSNRLLNKFWYLLNGVKSMIGTISMVDQIVGVEIDGKEAWVNENIGAIICLNLPSYMGGADLWGSKDSDEYTAPSISDQRLEVVAVTGTFHLVNVSINLATGMRVGQGNSLKITFKKNCPLSVQIDGEPWIQQPCAIEISFKNQVNMLRSRKELDFDDKALDFEDSLF